MARQFDPCDRCVSKYKDGCKTHIPCLIRLLIYEVWKNGKNGKEAKK